MRQVIFAFLLMLPVTLMSQEERMYTHHSDIVVDTSGVIRVSEKIKIYANGELFRRGITRELPTTRRDVNGRSLKVSYDVIGVYKNGKEDEYSITKSQTGNLLMYIGSKNILLEPGYYDYEIVYECSGQVGFYDAYDELAWNVNGAINTPVDLVSCEIRLPKDTEILSHRCYTGSYGSKDENCSAESSTNGVYKASYANVAANEMMTVYVGFEKGVVSEPVVKETFVSKLVTLLDSLGLWFANLVFIPLLFIYYVRSWRKHGVDPEKPVVVPQFSPPNGMSPACMSMIIDEGYDSRCISASIINLAVKGYIKIEDVSVKGILSLGSKHYKIVKLKGLDEDTPSEERVVLRYLFADGDEVLLDGKYNSNVETMMTRYRKDLEKQNKRFLSEGRNVKYKVLSLFVLIIYISLLFFYGRNEPLELYVALMVILIPTVFLVSFLQAIYFAIKKRKPKRLISVSLSVAVIVAVIGAFIYFPLNRLSDTAIALLVGLPIMLIGHILYSYLIIRPSEELLSLQSEINGLKMYIGLAEEKQMQYFNPPEVTPEVFEELLPYAIALKVDKVWGHKFEGSLAKSMMFTDSYVPLWYVGSMMRPATLSNSLRQSLYSNIRQGSTDISSSDGGNWSSGSFGGGSVGGGGGGGRTGGW